MLPEKLKYKQINNLDGKLIIKDTEGEVCMTFYCKGTDECNAALEIVRRYNGYAGQHESLNS